MVSMAGGGPTTVLKQRAAACRYDLNAISLLAIQRGGSRGGPAVWQGVAAALGGLLSVERAQGLLL